MHGREGEERKRRLHMWPVPAPGIGAAAAAVVNQSPSDSLQSASDCFLKDGRKIRVGECALFQAGNAPPFIGKIRWFRTSEENYLKLCVNWLYRPADIKLAKGILHDAAPNEVFYSFHKDVISAASLLHPCKVAFLRKGVELPAGISSFVCRRVYDIESKCLWWLTDQDYVDERQEEVDQLLDRTQLEMHAALQSGGRSPKPLNGPSSTHQLKPGSDSVQNSSSSLPSQVKGKKRDRSDPDTEPIKRDRDRSAKAEDGDSVSYKFDNIKAEIAKITEKGGLDNSEAVEKLVNLMLLDRTERKLDLAGRVMLADIIAATDRYDCLGRFVELRGVSVLDDWLQEAHKGKNGDGNSPKESDKATEELILALFRALDRLPVNLDALRACQIGKSVNNLRSHKNLEIQKKSRSLVDTWKKRVGAEMKINDAKSVGSSQAVTWPGKPGFSEVSHTGDRRSGSTEVIMKSPMSQPTAPKCMPGKPGHGDVITKSTPVASGSIKLQSSLSAPIAISSKDSPCKTTGGTGTPEMSLAAVKEEKSSSSSQSQNNSQSCSSDHLRAKGSLKEDARSSTAGSVNVGKTSGGSSRHRRSSNGLHGKNISGVQKEGSSGKSGSLNRTTTTDKTSPSGLTCDKPLEMPVADHGNSHKLIVRLHNPSRSPARSVSGGSFEDPSVMGSRASSPGLCEKPEQNNDHIVKPRSGASQSLIAMDADGESEQHNDKGRIGSDEGDRSLLGILEYQHSRGAEESGKGADIPRNACPSSGNEKRVFWTETRARNSFSSINALVESCAKYSEASAPLAVGDDIGMNLLASVAAGEICKSELISPCGSPKILPPEEEPCAGKNDAKSRLSSNEIVAPSHTQSDETTDVDSKKHDKNAEFSARDDSKQIGITFSSVKKTDLPLHNNITAEPTEQPPVSNSITHTCADSAIKSDGKLEEENVDRCLPMSGPGDTECGGNGPYQHQDKQIASEQIADSYIDCKPTTRSPSTEEHKNIDFTCEKVEEGKMDTSDVVCKGLDDGCDNTTSSRKIETLLVEGSSSSCPSGKEVQGPTTLNERPQHPVVSDHADALDRSGDDAVASSNSNKAPCPQNADESKTKMPDMHFLESNAIERKEHANFVPSSIDDRIGSAAVSLSTASGVDKNVEPKDNPTKSANCEVSPNIMVKEIEQRVKPTGSKMSSDDAGGSDDLASSAEVSSLAVKAESDVSAKLDFDLNESIHVDDGHPHPCEPASSAALVCSSDIHLPIVSPLVPPFSSSLPAPITVAAPAKGPFVPPENLLKSKGELGWKGSAPTSAFRPAEPRKVLEMPLSTSDIAVCDAVGKQCRPPLDIDLNVPDERLLEDMASQSSAQTLCSETGNSNHDAATRAACRLDLDLNRVDETNENGQLLASSSLRVDVPILPVISPYERFPNAAASSSRDFDLNDGPGVDEVVAELAPRSQVAKAPNNVPFLPPAAGLRMNNAEIANMFTWFPPSNSHPAVAIPSFLPDRGEQPYPLVAAPGAHRILGSVTGGSTFGSDIYRGPMLSSSPAMAFSPAAAFPYASFPFASSYPLASTSFSGGSTSYVDSSSAGASCFAAIPSQFVGPAGAATSHYPRPYMVSLAESSTIGGSENSRKWVRQGLDLNAGPGSINAEGRGDDRLPPSSRQVLVATSNAMLEEQARMYQVPGVGVKRKEPEGGWDAEKSAYKQLSWQQ
ncbi:uncharacterized protein [Typha latifolia]|uniref:uncharacterized protein n=1 Tax=Typha latifolia TaxID=4733 RepID=UPI003C2E89F0